MKPIEEVRKGDWVWSVAPETGDPELKQVEDVFVNETDEIVHVRYGDTEIDATPTHPFYVAEKGWVSAVNLRAGDRLQLVNGEYVTVEQVQHEIRESPVKVYNFRVADNHTYYVGHDNAVLVHNASCGVGRTGKQARLKQLADDDKLPRYLRGEIKRDMNEIVRGKRKTIRVPQGYELSHKIGKPAHRGYSYAFSDLNIKKQHRMHHKVFGYKIINEVDSMDKISGLLNASPEKRYKHFISTAADTEKVWMLCNDDGFASVDDEYINLLVFPEQCFAEMFADQDVPTEIDVYDFCERCAEIREDEKIRFAVFPNGKNATIVSAEDLLNDLKEELSLYE